MSLPPRWKRLRAKLRARLYTEGRANLSLGASYGADRVLSYLNGWHNFFDGGGGTDYKLMPYRPSALRVVDWRRGYDDARKGRAINPTWWQD